VTVAAQSKPSTSLAQACYYNMCGSGCRNTVAGVLGVLPPLLNTSTHPSQLLKALRGPSTARGPYCILLMHHMD